MSVATGLTLRYITNLVGRPVRVHHPQCDADGQSGYRDFTATDNRVQSDTPGLELAWVNRRGGCKLHHLDLIVHTGTPAQELGVALDKPPFSSKEDHEDLWKELRRRPGAEEGQ